MFMHRMLIEGDGLPFFNGQRPGGTDCQTKAGAVAKFFPADSGLAVYHLNGALGAGGNAFAAASTQVIINLNYLSANFIHLATPLFRYFDVRRLYQAIRPPPAALICLQYNHIPANAQ
jgi:hypothetical protein